MPRRPKYPLEALLEHRDRQVDDATADLGDAVRVREAADAKRERIAQAQKEAADEASATREAERDLLAAGELRVADLARTEAWELSVQRRAEDLARAASHATGEVDAARTAEENAREGLARKKADRDVVEKDRSRFADRVKRATDAAEEEDASEAWRGNRGSK